jgi:hypothetical protein
MGPTVRAATMRVSPRDSLTGKVESSLTHHPLPPVPLATPQELQKIASLRFTFRLRYLIVNLVTKRVSRVGTSTGQMPTSPIVPRLQPVRLVTPMENRKIASLRSTSRHKVLIVNPVTRPLSPHLQIGKMESLITIRLRPIAELVTPQERPTIASQLRLPYTFQSPLERIVNLVTWPV